MRTRLAALAVLTLCLATAACQRTTKTNAVPIVGTWLVKVPEAPFTYHMFIFHSDGTVQQSNPDAGDPNTSDSAALGAWTPDGGGFRGKIVEVTADRTTHQFVSRGEISFVIQVSGNSLSGAATAIFFDVEGKQIRGPIKATLNGSRITP